MIRAWPSGRRGAALGVAITALALTPLAQATSPSKSAESPSTRLQQKRLLSYPLEQVWPACVRYLRVDRRYPITDLNPEIGYVLFEIPLGPERSTQGSVEFIRTTDPSGRPAVDVLVSTDGGPTHLPFTLLDGIAGKVRQERGSPAPPPPPPEAPPTPPPRDDDDDDLQLPPGGAPPLIEH